MSRLLRQSVFRRRPGRCLGASLGFVAMRPASRVSRSAAAAEPHTVDWSTAYRNELNELLGADAMPNTQQPSQALASSLHGDASADGPPMQGTSRSVSSDPESASMQPSPRAVSSQDEVNLHRWEYLSKRTGGADDAEAARFQRAVMVLNRALRVAGDGGMLVTAVSRHLGDEYASDKTRLAAMLTRCHIEGYVRVKGQKYCSGSFGAWIRQRRPVSPQERPRLGELQSEVDAIYAELEPSEAAFQKRKLVIRRVERAVAAKARMPQITVRPFGSFVNMLYLEDSDLDLCVTVPSALRSKYQTGFVKSSKVESAVKHMADREGVENFRNARVPIISFRDARTGLKVDINVGYTLGMENSRLVGNYVMFDPRVRPLVYVIKYWAKMRRINSTKFGTLSSYSYILMVIHYLQQLARPVLPSAHECHPQRVEMHYDQDGLKVIRTAYCRDTDRMHKALQKNTVNTQTTAELLYGFFAYYSGVEHGGLAPFDHVRNCVQITSTQPVSKESLPKHVRLTRLTIMDPLIWRNCGITMADNATDVVLSEFHRAYRLLHDGHSFANVLQEEYL